MKQFIKRYAFALVVILFTLIIAIVNWELGKRAIGTTLFSLKEMLLVLPPIFILLGLLDIWVPREIMVKFMGKDSGLKGILIAIFLGSATAGPLYGAFPIAAVLLRKGAALRNIFIFIGAWSTTKIPMFLFEYSGLGARFALTRLAVDLPGIVIIGFLLAALLNEKDKTTIKTQIDAVSDK